ncbi:hypothetical protein Q6348_00340 [Isoptericola sp. b441]|uniref:NmrA-like domain-containing protein n=1 Tax=Actinotalea lenta TaxID=3064654 RepID=A0ABT9D4L6_9CELL|nr:hypothetical protein [Isoptericola sp. b441]MDO8105644.1 hypothetical protein [Isoptericola sp. b441]
MRPPPRCGPGGVDTRDIGVAARVFGDPAAHHGAGYTLTGPEALDFPQVAAILAAELGRAITYRPAGVLPYAAHLRRTGLPLAQVAVQTVLHVGLRRGQADHVDPTLERLLGRPGRTVAEYVHDHRGRWALPGALASGART